MPVEDIGGIKAFVPNKIPADSWLRAEGREWFLEGYFYAMTQTHAIPSLAKIPPEDLFFVVSSILRGVRRAGMEIPPQ